MAVDLLHTVAITILTLGILVTIHEWGHFYVARLCGVKVLRFSVGFGKALYSWKDRQGTEYAIATIPLGGYVKMLDEREEDVAPEQLDQAFNRKPVLQRMAIVVAGPAVNLIFAVIAYWFMYVAGVSTIAPIVGSVVAESVASKSGIPDGVEIVAVDGESTLTWDEVNLRLAARVGESGELALLLKEQGSSINRQFILTLQDWHVDLEKESPVAALGLIPWRPEVPAVIGRLVEGGRAELSGLQLGDEIITANGKSLLNWYSFVELVKVSPDASLSIDVRRNGHVIDIDIVPESKTDDAGVQYGYIGAAASPVGWPEEYKRTLEYGFLSGIEKAFNKTLQMIALTLDSIWKMIEGVISVKNLSGPITIAKVASASASSGLESYISFLAYLSISLGILNLLPIPVLDGGHLLYYTVELITRKPVSERVQLFGLKLGMAMLLTLMFVALFNDFMRL